MKRNSIELLVATLMGSLLIPAGLFAMGGRVTSPVISIPRPGIPGGTIDLIFPSPDQVRILLFEDFEMAFAGGYFINSMTKLYFTGDAAPLNRMLAELAGTEGVVFVVRFSRKPIKADVPFAGEKDVKVDPPTAQWRNPARRPAKHLDHDSHQRRRHRPGSIAAARDHWKTERI